MYLLIDLGTFHAEHGGGKDEVAYNLLRGFSAIGHTDDILCVCRGELVDIVRSIDPGYQTLVLDRKERRGVLDIPRAIVSRFRYGKRLRAIAADHRCDCVLYTNKPAPPVRLGVPTALLAHDIQATIKLLRDHELSVWNCRMAIGATINFRQCDRVIAISDFDAEGMRSCFPRQVDKIARIYNPIRFRDVPCRGDGPYITALNIQHPHKNTVTLVRAYAEIANDIEEQLLLVGKRCYDPAIEEEIDEVIREHRLVDRVIRTGFVDNAELERIIAQTRIYVNPSLFEGFGMTAVEMMGCGVPTICNRGTALPESTLGLCRYYEPGTDAVALAQAICEELDNPTPARELAEAARCVREAYDYRVIAQQYWDFLSGLTR
jgi:glycosyltransferase involved in cell wall biosynthesis